MRRIAIATIALMLSSAPAFAETLRSATHLVKIDVQPRSGASRQYDVEVFDGESRSSVTKLNVITKGDAPAQSQITANGTQYTARITPHGDSYLIEVKADGGAENVDVIRGGFTTTKAKPNPARQRARGGRDIDAPKVLRRVDAVYTEEARAAGAAGTVMLEVQIDRSGFVQEAKVTKSMGLGLDESALDAVKQWQFEPSRQNRTPVEVVQEVTIEFKP